MYICRILLIQLLGCHIENACLAKKSPSKCSVMYINSNVQCPNINQLVCHIGQTRLPVADCITDLVITYNNRLKFSPHVDNVVAKASLILRCFQSRVLLTKAFCVFVRPILEFSSVVWNPLLENIAKVESVQRRFIKRF